MQTIKQYIKISRYRFWLYTAGPFLLGTVLGISQVTDLLRFDFFIVLIFFLIPFNFFIYSVNDFFDEDTDKYNSKKTEQETKYTKDLNRIYRWGLISFAVLFIVVFLILNPVNRILLILVTAVSYFYSAPPIRFKSKYIVDSLSNILYAIPGFIGFFMFNQPVIPWQFIYIGFAYNAAMHLFSAIPDIEADKLAQLKTSAILFGKKLSLVVCLVLWFSISLILLSANLLIFSISLIYSLLVLIVIIKPNLLTKVYWLFPYVNGIAGFIIFWIIAINKFFI